MTDGVAYLALPRMPHRFALAWAGTPLTEGIAALEGGAAWRRIGVAGLQFHSYGRPGLDGEPTIPAAGDRVQLVREPDNPHDPSAILVEWRNGILLGHVPRGEARLLAPELDAGVDVQAYVTDPGRGLRAWEVGLLLIGPAAAVLWEGRRAPEPPAIPLPPEPYDPDDEVPF